MNLSQFTSFVHALNHLKAIQTIVRTQNGYGLAEPSAAAPLTQSLDTSGKVFSVASDCLELITASQENDCVLKLLELAKGIQTYAEKKSINDDKGKAEILGKIKKIAAERMLEKQSESKQKNQVLSPYESAMKAQAQVYKDALADGVNQDLSLDQAYGHAYSQAYAYAYAYAIKSHKTAEEAHQYAACEVSRNVILRAQKQGKSILEASAWAKNQEYDYKITRLQEIGKLGDAAIQAQQKLMFLRTEVEKINANVKKLKASSTTPKSSIAHASLLQGYAQAMAQFQGQAADLEGFLAKIRLTTQATASSPMFAEKKTASFKK